MSETTIVGKPVVPSVKVSSNDPHRITTPVARPQRPSQSGGEVKPSVGGVELETAPRRHGGGGQPLRAQNHDVQIVARPVIDHQTSNSSSKSTVIRPTTQPRKGTQQQRPGLVGSAPPVQGAIPQDEYELITQLLQSYRDGLPESAKASRELARRAAVTCWQLVGQPK